MAQVARSLDTTMLGQSSDLFGQILPWLGVLLGVVIVGAVVIFAIRKRVLGDDSAAAGGFTLHDLRQLHASGEISDEEFERAREQMIGRVRTAAETTAEDAAGDLHDAADGSSGQGIQSDSRPDRE